MPLGEKTVESCILFLGALGLDSNGCLEPCTLWSPRLLSELLSWGTADFLSFASDFLTFKILWMRVCVCVHV